MPVRVEKVNYGGWPNCYRISNGEVDLVVTGDVGPRVIRYGFAGGQNFFKEFAGQMGGSGEPHGSPAAATGSGSLPKIRSRAMLPTTGRSGSRCGIGRLQATEPVEPLTGIEKQLAVRMDPSGTSVVVEHHLRNAGREPYRLAPWALSMMASGGSGIHGFPPRGTHPEMLAPANPLVMWRFTNLRDPRWHLLRKYLVLTQDPSNPEPQKLGSFHRNTWGAYLLNGELFLKRFHAAGIPAIIRISAARSRPSAMPSSWSWRLSVLYVLSRRESPCRTRSDGMPSAISRSPSGTTRSWTGSSCRCLVPKGKFVSSATLARGRAVYRRCGAT